MIQMLLLLILLIFILTFVYASWRAAPWVPIHSKDVVRLIKLAHIQQGQRVYDLGCGDARVVCAAARAGARATGFEVSLLPYLLAQARIALQKNKNARVCYRDFWSADLRDADLVYFFLMPKIYPKLKEKLERELKPGAKIIAYVWPFPDWTPTACDRMPGQPTLYLYTRSYYGHHTMESHLRFS
ncbi:MAG: hypothetical protein HY981_00585 [Candidatus Magasanikbacteria bacterium]|nr:hypothetical protein [Candidatus Magasanikbacteria bacterium]